jgi:hypothetical protein
MSGTFYLGRYNCIEPIGAGALGETFRAKIYGVAGFEKQLAVKRIRAELCADPGFLERFVKAASAASALGHDRITQIHEVGAQGSLYYVAADLARGIDAWRLHVGTKQRGEALTPDSAVTLVLDVLEGLAYAHGRRDLSANGVLHLGLGPQSVMVSPEGDARLLDVGLFAALAVPGWASDERASIVSWVAPEVSGGGAPDVRADVFSAGALLYLLLSGSAPFSGVTTAEIRQKQLAGPPPPPACDGGLQAALGRALAPDAAARFPSVEAFTEALRPLLTSRAARARGDLAMLVRRLSAQASAPAPQEPVLEPTKNTFAGVGPADAVPVQRVVLPGPATEKGMEAVDPLGATAAMPVLPVGGPKSDAPLAPPITLQAAPQVVVVEPLKPPPGERPEAEPLRTLLPVLPRTARVAALPDAPSRGMRRALIAGGAALSALAGAGLWIYFSGAEPAVPPTTTPTTTTPTVLVPPAASVAATPTPVAPIAQSTAPSPAPAKGSAALIVSTVPAGAALFVDGEPRGPAPLSLPLPSGPHQVVAIAEHSKIRQEEVRVDGTTRLAWTLEPARTSGPAGLKIRCKSRGELRILIDGADSGFACPNETRINTTPGEHTVGLYSPKSGKTVEVKATVKDDVDHSTRIYLSY